jgi:hypothetical protein
MNLRVDLEVTSGLTRLLMATAFLLSSKSGGEYEDVCRPFVHVLHGRMAFVK